MRHKAGLTLIEMLATLTIVAMLMFAAMSAVGGLLRSGNAEKLRAQEKALRQPLRDAIATDLLHAGRFKLQGNGFVLETLSSLDADTLELSHLPVIVEYRVEMIGKQSYLARVEMPLVRKTQSRELLCPARSVTLHVAEDIPAGKDWFALKGDIAVTVEFADDQREAEVVDMQKGGGKQ